MQLSFSTLGCPGWTFDEIVRNAVKLGFDGIGFRGVGAELDLRRVPEFAASALAGTRRRLADAGLEPAMLLASTKLMAAAGEIDGHLEEGRAYIEMAAALGCPAVRVFGGAIPGGVSLAAAVRRAAARLRILGEHAAPLGVKVLLETHDDWVDPRRTEGLMRAADHPALGVLWDVHHPWRIGGVSIEQPWEMLGRWIAGVDLKDSAEDFGQPYGYRYVLPGEGEVPLSEAVTLLAEGGYDGWLSFEWEKRWHPEIEEPEVAFPAFIRYARERLGVAGRPS